MTLRPAHAALPPCSRRLVLRAGSAGVVLAAMAPLAARATLISVSVLTYGARPDGSADATSAFNRALLAIALAGGGQLIVPPGRYLIAGNVVYLGGGPLAVIGAGLDVSLLDITTRGGAAFALTPISNTVSVTLRDIGFLPGGGSHVLGCTALLVAFPSLTISQGLLLENVDFGPFLPSSSAFQTTIALVNVGRGQIRNVTAHGNFPNGPQTGTTFLTMAGCIDLRLDNVSFDNIDVGVYVAGYCEGLHLHGCVVIANHGIRTGYGLTYNNGAGVPVNLLGLYVSDCEFNCAGGTLELYQVNTGWITGSHFGSAGAFYGVNIALWGSMSVIISACSITGAFNGANNGATGLFLAASTTVGADNNQFDGLSFQNTTTGVYLAGGMANNTGKGLRMYAYGLGSLVGSPYVQGSQTIQAVNDQSGNTSNVFEWIASTTAPNHATDRYLYNQVR